MKLDVAFAGRLGVKAPLAAVEYAHERVGVDVVDDVALEPAEAARRILEDRAADPQTAVVSARLLRVDVARLHVLDERLDGVRRGAIARHGRRRVLALVPHAAVVVGRRRVGRGALAHRRTSHIARAGSGLAIATDPAEVATTTAACAHTAARDDCRAGSGGAGGGRCRRREAATAAQTARYAAVARAAARVDARGGRRVALVVVVVVVVVSDSALVVDDWLHVDDGGGGVERVVFVRRRRRRC